MGKVKDLIVKRTTLDDLADYHRAKVLFKAREWRLNNHAVVMKLLVLVFSGGEPVGAVIFSPELWTGENWFWFREHVLKNGTVLKNGLAVIDE